MARDVINEKLYELRNPNKYYYETKMLNLISISVFNLLVFNLFNKISYLIEINYINSVA